MPRQAKPIRLWLKPAEDDRAAVWVIKHGRRRLSTGFGADARGEAEGRLSDYIAGQRDPAKIPQGDPHQTRIADVLAVYMRDVCPSVARPVKAVDRCTRLVTWWGQRTLADISPETCRAYAKAHSIGGGRRDLEDLRAAINHHARRKLHVGVVDVKLPPRGKARTKYLTRDEVAHLLWACWRHKRTQRPSRGARKGEEVEGQTFHDLRHLARFILMGVYTGSRSSPLLKASFKAASDRAYLDLDQGLYYRLPNDMAEAENKRSPVTRIYPRLLAHLRRWQRLDEAAGGAQFVVQWHGKPVTSIKNAWATAVDLAEIEGHPVPHTLRHTCITWLKQGGASSFVAGDFAGMSEQMVDRVYKHHDPRFQQQAFDAFRANRSAGAKRDRNRRTNRDAAGRPATNSTQNHKG